MEMRTNRAVITTAEPLGTTIQEQGIELDYVLPDYYPDVCKLVKCFITPTIVSESVNGDRLSYELRADVRILYCSEDSHVLQCVTQTLRFTRTAELPAGENITAELCPVTDYVNCRAVSRRRLDVRGAVTIRIRTSAVRQQEVLSDVFSKNMQLLKCPVQFPASRICEERSILVSEELELGSAKPPVLHIVRCDARSVEQSQRFVSGKLMVQGSLQVQLLYACEKDGDGSLEPMSFRIPYSQLVEMDGAQEQDDCRVAVSVVSCELKPVADVNGDIRLLRCEAELRVVCTALHMASESLVCDAFSTEHESTVQRISVPVAGAPVPFSEMLVSSTKLQCTDGELDCVYDAWCEVRNLTTETEGAEIIISGMLCCLCLVRESSGMPMLIEKEESFVHRFAPSTLGPDDQLQLEAYAENCSYTLSGASEVTLKAELRMEGTLTHCAMTEVLTDVEVHEDTVLPRPVALKLYFGTAGEPVWEIAKRAHTSVEAIMAENDLTDEVLAENGMLLIPIIS